MIRKNGRSKLIATILLLCMSVELAACDGKRTPEEEVRRQLEERAALQADAEEMSETGNNADIVAADGGEMSGTGNYADIEATANEGDMSGAGNKADTEVKADAGDDYVSPVDFDLLYSQNEEICAWLYIPGTNISYPILKSRSDDSFYLEHDSLCGESVSGSLFLDDFNEADLQDPLTVIYGHHMKSGAYFGELQSYFDSEEEFRQHEKIVLYLPEEEEHYEAFAAVPYNMNHILYNYDFSDVSQFFVFFDNIYGVRALNAFALEERYPSFGDKVLVLSTCLEGDNSRRYLVLAKEVKCDEEN